MTIEFGALVGLMVLGTDAPDTIAGEIQVRDVRQVDAGAAATSHERVEEHPALGRVAVGEYEYRIFRHGALSRRERLDGTVVSVDGVATRWARLGDEEEFTAFPRSAGFTVAGAPIGGLEVGGPRPSWGRWDGTDYTRPTGAVGAGRFLDRAVWEVELAPPRHKPYPIQLTVDAATGLVLREGSRDVGWRAEFASVSIGTQLPDDLFTWTGRSHPPRSRAEQQAEYARELAERRAWLDARGMGELPIAVPPQLTLNAWDDESAELLLSFEVEADGSLLRRGHTPAPWRDADRLGWPHVYRWADERFDWCLGCSAPVDAEQLALLRVRLAATT